MVKIAWGSIREATQLDCIKALVVEFITTFLFVFAGVGTAMAAGILKMHLYLACYMVYMHHSHLNIFVKISATILRFIAFSS